MKPRALFPLGLMALSMLAFAAQGITLKRTPKVGDKANFKITGSFESSGIEGKLTGKVRDEVTKVDADSFTTKSVTTMSIDVAGQQMDQPESTETTTLKLDGSIVEVKSGENAADGSALRIAHLNTVFLPSKEVKVDDTWTYEGKKDEKADTPGYKIEYKLVGEEKVGNWDTYKITATGGEIEGATPTKVKSTVWIEKSTGNHVRSLTELTDAIFQAGLPPINGKMDIVREP